MHELPALAREIGVARLWVKDEGLNPTASFKARGMSAAVTRARALGVPGFVVPTAGNAGAALAAYGAAAGLPVRVYAPATTPRPSSTRSACSAPSCSSSTATSATRGSRRARSPPSSGYFDISTLREPYRIEGKKTMGFELAEQLGWTLPTHIIYPTGGGTGLIGMWKAFAEMRDGGWLPRDVALPQHDRRAGGRLRADRARVRSRRGSRDAVGESDDARERAARARPARRSAHSARAARERGRRARR